MLRKIGLVIAAPFVFVGWVLGHTLIIAGMLVLRLIGVEQ